MQLRVQLLNGVDLQVIEVLHALNRRMGTSNGGEGGHPSQQRRGANLP